MELMRTEACAGRAGKRRIELADLEQGKRLHAVVIADVEDRHAGMRTPTPRLLFVGALRLILFVNGDCNAPAAEPGRDRHDRMRGLRKGRMIVNAPRGLWWSQTAPVASAKPAMPAARPHFVAKAQGGVQPVPFASPRGCFPAGSMLSRHPPARDFHRFLWILQIVDDEDIADEAFHLG